MKIDYKTNNELTSDEVIKVFQSVGWNKNSNDIIAAFKNSYYVTAYYNNELVAFARAISDGYYYTNIFDVIVMPDFQKRGIAKNLMKLLMKKFKGTYFFLSYTPGNKAFYSKCSFEELPSGMWIDRQKSFNLDLEKL